MINRLHDTTRNTNCYQAVDDQIDTKDPAYTKHPIIYFHFITWMLISVIVTLLPYTENNVISYDNNILLYYYTILLSF